MVLCQVIPLRRPSLQRGMLKRVRESETNCSEFLSSVVGRGYPMSNFKNRVEGPKELGGCKLANPNPIVIDVNRLKTVKSITQLDNSVKVD